MILRSHAVAGTNDEGLRKHGLDPIDRLRALSRFDKLKFPNPSKDKRRAGRNGKASGSNTQRPARRSRNQPALPWLIVETARAPGLAGLAIRAGLARLRAARV